jgi:hypothetical protein
MVGTGLNDIADVGYETKDSFLRLIQPDSDERSVIHCDFQFLACCDQVKTVIVTAQNG